MQYLIFDLEEQDNNYKYILLEFPSQTTTGWGNIRNMFSKENRLMNMNASSIEEYFNEVAGISIVCSAPTITYEYLTIHHPELLL